MVRLASLRAASHLNGVKFILSKSLASRYPENLLPCLLKLLQPSFVRTRLDHVHHLPYANESLFPRLVSASISFYCETWRAGVYDAFSCDWADDICNNSAHRHLNNTKEGILSLLWPHISSQRAYIRTITK